MVRAKRPHETTRKLIRFRGSEANEREEMNEVSLFRSLIHFINSLYSFHSPIILVSTAASMSPVVVRSLCSLLDKKSDRQLEDWAP